MATPAQIVANMPISPDLSFESDKGMHLDNHVVHGRLVDERGVVKAYLREHYDGNLRPGLIALNGLESHGISVAKRLPFISTGGEEMLLVEYIEGPDLHESDAAPDIFYDLAVKLGRYTASCFIKSERLLTDIYDPFQYVLRKDTPVLVDLDMFLYDAVEPEVTVFHSENAFKDLSEVYEEFLPSSQFGKLNAVLAALHHTVTASC